jgi:hypothetical protein
MKAVLELVDELKATLGAVVPIADVPDIAVGEVTVEGEVIQLPLSKMEKVWSVSHSETGSDLERLKYMY